ncbi:MAG: porin [Roseateles depolymerans]|uniref:Porin n=1 Tax=Roseateles depolymerans TaxID=76731 RepID=A0A2W5D9N8_9BURK|nr:MAG: porin [Roseateles depolymerans]
MKGFVFIACALLAGLPAFAQGTLTLWGRFNTSVESQKFGDAPRRAVMQNNGSRLGLKGDEDLGAGLRASFWLEHGFNADSGAASGTTFWNRASYVELASAALGGVRVGQWFPGSYYATADYVSIFNHDTGTSADALYATRFQTSNKLAYFSPRAGGWGAELSVAAGEGTTTRATDASVSYDAGAAHAGLGYERKGSFTQVALRGLHEFGPLVLGGYLQRAQDDRPGVGRRHWQVWRLAGMYAVGAAELHVSVGRAGDILGEDGARQLLLGLNYHLSRRTKLYGFYTRLDNQARAVYTPGGLSGSAPGADFSALSAGLRHNF